MLVCLMHTHTHTAAEVPLSVPGAIRGKLPVPSEAAADMLLWKRPDQFSDP